MPVSLVPAYEALAADIRDLGAECVFGLMSDDTAQRHPMRNIVTRALGSRQDVLVDITTTRLEPNDVFVLCSDGLNTMLTDEEIRETLLRHRDDPEAACRALIYGANLRGGEDNVTVLAIRFS